MIELISNVSSTSVHVNWSAIPIDALNEESLAGYSMFFKESTEPSYSISHMKAIKDIQSRSTILDGLKKYTDYTVRVLAFTIKGNGIASTPVDFKTQEDGE